MKPNVRISLSLLAILMSQLWFGSRANAEDCVVSCISGFSCNYFHSPGLPPPDCSAQRSHQLQLCEIACRGKNGAVATGWGSIAYSAKEKAWGSSYAHDSKATAQKVALGYCNQRAANCVTRVDFYNSCGAVAADGEKVGSGTGPNKAGAEQKAVAACSAAGGKRCAVEASVCSGAGSASAPGTPSAPRAISWGAIAYSNKDSGSGWSQGKNDRASAEKEALGACAQRGRNCELQTSFNKECGALAVDREFFGWGTNQDQRAAQQRAIEECKKDGGTRCTLRISFCSF
jgi:hypothetical protein